MPQETKIVQIPASDLFKMKRNIEKLAIAAEASDMINESEAAKLLDISKDALQNKVYKKEMEGLYNIGIGGRRFYSKSKLIGLYK